MKQRIHTFGNDLLGSVLMRLLSAWRLAEKLDAELICHWPEKTALRDGFRFADLFEGSPPFTLSHAYPNLAGIPTLHDALDGVNIDPAKLAPEFVYSSTGITLLPGENLQDARREARGLFNRLNLVAPIRNAIAEIDASVPLKDSVAVHVRRGTDIVPPLRAGGLPPAKEEAFVRGYVRAYVDLESYRRAVSALGSPKCFVFCPDPQDRAKIKHDIGGYTVDEFPTIQFLAPLQQDLAEILVMSRTGRLLGVKSNYSGLATLLGDLPLEWAARWLSADDMIAMMRNIFPGQVELHARIMKASSEWYARVAPQASRQFADITAQLEQEIASAHHRTIGTVAE